MIKYRQPKHVKKLVAQLNKLPPLTKFYFSADLANAYVRHLKAEVEGRSRMDALMQFVRELDVKELDVTHISNMSFSQYEASQISAISDVSAVHPVITASPTNPV